MEQQKKNEEDANNQQIRLQKLEIDQQKLNVKQSLEEENVKAKSQCPASQILAEEFQKG